MSFFTGRFPLHRRAMCRVWADPEAHACGFDGKLISIIAHRKSMGPDECHLLDFAWSQSNTPESFPS
jgi:hypothetical protein